MIVQRVLLVCYQSQKVFQWVLLLRGSLIVFLFEPLFVEDDGKTWILRTRLGFKLKLNGDGRDYAYSTVYHGIEK